MALLRHDFNESGVPASKGFAINARLSAVTEWSSFYAIIPGINNGKASKRLWRVPTSGELSV